MKQRIFTLRQIIEEGTAKLEAVGIDGAARDAWYLMEYAAGITRAVYYGEPERVIPQEIVLRYQECVERRRQRIPLQHIIGEQEFMGLPFYVDGHVLVPRQDTETLVEEAVKRIRGMCRKEQDCGTFPKEHGEGEQDRIRVLDMCTGSGCILLSVLKMCPNAQGVGCDISQEALAVARKNGDRLGLRADWVCSDLFAGIGPSKYDVIVSNPPYIPTADIEGLQDEVRFHDPLIALDGGEDGLDFYKRIVRDSISYIKRGGSLLFEIGCGQGKDVSELMKSCGYENVAVEKDLSGLDRVAAGIYAGDGACAGGKPFGDYLFQEEERCLTD